MQDERPTKRTRVVPTFPDGEDVVIGTHSGAFHADEALACYLLKLLPEFSESTIVRSRDPAQLEKCFIVVDVGGTYDHEKRRYDHHQRGFSEVFQIDGSDNFGIKLSSAGLIYYHYGRQIIAQILGTNDADTATLFKKMYTSFVQEIDAVDNGVSVCEKGTTPIYHVNSNVSARVGRLNAPWNKKDMNQDDQFTKAMTLIGDEFVSVLRGFHESWMPARDLVIEAVKNRKDVDPSGGIIEFTGGSCPWKSHFYDIEKQFASEGEVKYVIYPDESKNYRVQCVSMDANSFENRRSLPEPWRGIRDEALSTLSGIPDCIFVHAAGFIGGTKTRDGAVAMARAGLQN